MQTALKQRLVGALILVSLGVVFWPIIFGAPQPGAARVKSTVPPAPAVDTTELPAPDGAGLRASPSTSAALGIADEAPDVLLPIASSGETVPQPGQGIAPYELPSPTTDTPYPTRAKAPVRPALDEDGIPIAWVLQVATISDRQKAEQLRDELIAADLKAYITPLERERDVLFRLYVGPKFERAKIDALKRSIDARYGVDSLVARYVP